MATEVNASQQPHNPSLFHPSESTNALAPQVYDTMLAQVSDAVLAVDNLLRVVYLNPAAERQYGVTAAEALGRPLDELYQNRWLHPEDEAAAWQALETTGCWRGESLHRTLAGRELYVESSVSRLHDLYGAPAGLVAVIRDITESKRVEAGAQLAATIIESSDDAIISKTLEGVITSWNKAAERVFGYAAEEALGRPIVLLIPPELAHEEALILEQIRRGERVEHYESERVRKDGHRIQVSLTISPIRDASGAVIGASKIARDITEQKRIEAAHLASQAMYRTLFESTMDAVFIGDAQGNYIDVNPAAAELLGVPREQLLGQHYGKFIPSEATEEAKKIGSVVRQQGVWQGEFPMRRADGATVWADYRTRFDGQYVVGVARDITERKRVEEELRRSEERFRRLVEVSAQMTWLTNAQGEPTEDSPSWRAFTGRSYEQWRGWNWLDVIHPDDRARVAEVWRHAVATVSPYKIEFRQLHHSGAYRNIRCQAAPILNADGSVREWVGMNVDITERKQAEEALRRSEEQLRRAQEAAQLGAWDWDVAHNQITWSDGIYRLLGLAPSSFDPSLDRCLEFVLPEDHARTQQAVQEAMARGGQFSFEFRVRRTDGAVRWLASIGSVEAEAEGAAPRLRGVNIDITERKRQELALRENQARERAYLEHLPVGIWFLNGQGQITYGNAAGQQIWAGARYVGVEQFGEYKGWWHGTNQRLGPEDWAASRALRQGETSLDEEIDIECFDGSRKTILNSAVPVRDVDGAVIGAVVFNQDITERKRAEESLRESEERLRLATQAGKVGIWDWDVASNHVSWTDSLYAIHGVTKEEFQATVEGFAALVHPADRERVAQAIERTLKEGAPYGLTFRAVRPDGEVIWLFTNAVVLRSAGQPVRLLGATVDITDLKRTEEALRESQERLTGLINSAMDAVITVNEEQRIVLFNPAAERMFGCPAAEALGSPLERFIPAEFRVAHCQHIERFGQLGVTARRMDALGILSGLRASGQEFPIEASISHVEVGGKRLFTVILRDITERKEAEAERERLFAQEQRARALAEAATLAKDEFLSVVSHELRTPLNAILGYTRITRTRAHDPVQVARNCDVIERNAKMQQQLIEDLLDTARIMSGKLKLEIAPTDLRLVLEDALTVVQPIAEAKRIELVTQLNDEPPIILGDAARLQQIAWNLLQNAVKFTPEGGRVELRLAADSRHLRFMVSDTGKGIEPEFLPHVFDRFSQQDGSSRRRHGGLGLGLALVKQLVELHGGTISVTSAGIDQGSTFTVTLPLRAPQILAPRPPRVFAQVHTGPEAIPLTDVPRLDGVRVLLVEDQEEARQLLADTLKECGAVVTAAASGPAARLCLAEASFDVLVCDIAMPEEDGYEVLRRLRAQEEERGLAISQRLPAIALTALARAEDRLRALTAGFQMHVAKPVEMAELITVIASLLRNRQKGAAVS
jgi:PAS domain S-box-containing protein